MSKQRSVVGSAKLIALCTLCSRFTGLARDILLARAFGLSWVQDAWVYAFQFPNLFRRLFGEGAMAAAFVPTFTRTLEEEGRPAGWQLLARTLALLTVALTVLILAITLIIALIWWFAPVAPNHAAARHLLLALTATMLPFMLTICVLALFSSILNCLGSFVPAAIAPVVLNLCMIVGIAVLAPGLCPHDPRRQVFVVAGTVLAAGVLQIVLMIPIMRAYGVQLGFRLDLHDPHVRKLMRLVVPVLLGQGVLALGVYLDAQICVLLTHKNGTSTTASLLGINFTYPLEEGALSAITYAQRLYQFPLGVLAISLATAALPAFSRLAGRQAWGEWAHEVRQSIRLAIFEGLLAGMLMIVLAEPIFRFLFEYGLISAADTARAARLVVLYGCGLWAFASLHLVLRAFYSLQDVRTPLWISVALLPLTVLVNVTLVWLPGVREATFAFSSCISASLSVVIGLVLLARRTGQPLLERETFSAVGRMVVAAAAAGLIVWLVQPSWTALAHRVSWTVPQRAIETLGLLGVGTLAYLALARILQLQEVRVLLHWRRHET